MTKDDFLRLENFDIYLAQSLGTRKNQEDFAKFHFSNNQTELLVVLADGMGGHASGEIASRASVDEFVKTFKFGDFDSSHSSLRDSLNAANHRLRSLLEVDSKLAGMGCTFVGVYIQFEKLRWISVGDSPFYLFRKNILTRLNQDHSMLGWVKESLQLGKITADEAKNFPNKNALRSALIGSEISIVDESVIPCNLQEGDVLLLASDGLLTLEHSEICKVVHDHNTLSAKNIANALLEEVINKNSPQQDNVTIQVVKVSRLNNCTSDRKRFNLFLIALILILLFIWALKGL